MCCAHDMKGQVTGLPTWSRQVTFLPTAEDRSHVSHLQRAGHMFPTWSCRSHAFYPEWTGNMSASWTGRKGQMSPTWRADGTHVSYLELAGQLSRAGWPDDPPPHSHAQSPRLKKKLQRLRLLQPLSIYLSIYLSDYLSIYLSFLHFLSAYKCMYLFTWNCN